VIVLLQIFSGFWQWNNFENRLIFDEVKAYKKWCHFLGLPVSLIDLLSELSNRTISFSFVRWRHAIVNVGYAVVAIVITTPLMISILKMPLVLGSWDNAVQRPLGSVSRCAEQIVPVLPASNKPVLSCCHANIQCESKSSPLKLLRYFHLCNWKISWLLSKHFPMITPILANLSSYLYELYHLYRAAWNADAVYSDENPSVLSSNAWIVTKPKKNLSRFL